MKPTYRAGWEAPGGTVEADEAPRSAVRREVAEELGLDLDVGRLLCLEWQGPEPDRTESLMFVYDGGVLDDVEITLAADELSAYEFAAPDQLDDYLSPRLSRRLRAGLTAVEDGGTVEMEHGAVVAPRR